MAQSAELGGNQRIGVFATRSPFRPNPLGLSCVKLERLEHSAEEGTILIVSGVDLLDGTPIFDIKPYIPYADSRPDAMGSYGDALQSYQLNVVFPPEFLQIIPEEKRSAVCACLADDPRPSYQNDSERIYHMFFAGYEIHFRVKDMTLTVIAVDK